jgi:hypothetical protein
VASITNFTASSRNSGENTLFCRAITAPLICVDKSYPLSENRGAPQVEIEGIALAAAGAATLDEDGTRQLELGGWMLGLPGFRFLACAEFEGELQVQSETTEDLIGARRAPAWPRCTTGGCVWCGTCPPRGAGWCCAGRLDFANRANYKRSSLDYGSARDAAEPSGPSSPLTRNHGESVTNGLIDQHASAAGTRPSLIMLFRSLPFVKCITV